MNKLFAAVIGVACVLAIALMLWRAQKPAAEITEAGGTELQTCNQTTPFDFRCEGNYLVYKACVGGKASEKRYDCSSFKTETTVGYCNPRYPTAEGVKASCDLREPSAGGNATPTAQPTASAGPLPYAASYCGDAKCDFVEDCNNCAKDCGCGGNAVCGANGVCYNYFCGDGKCGSGESQENCCQDCGCPGGKECNPPTGKCEKHFSKELNESLALMNYLGGSFKNYSIASSIKTFYSNIPVEEIVLKCDYNTSFECGRVIYIAENGSVVQDVSLA